MMGGQVPPHMFQGYCLMCNKEDLWRIPQTCCSGGCRGSDIGMDRCFVTVAFYG